MQTWIVQNTTPKRQPVWSGGGVVKSFSNNTESPDVGIVYEPKTITNILFSPTYLIPFLAGFRLTGLPNYAVDTSPRQLSIDLNSCYLVTIDPITTLTVPVELYFVDMDSYKDIQWVTGDVYLNSETTPHKVEDLPYLGINSNVLVKVITNIDIFQPFCGLTPIVEKNKGYSIQTNVTSPTVSFFNKIYKLDYSLKPYTYVRNGSSLLLIGNDIS